MHLRKKVGLSRAAALQLSPSVCCAATHGSLMKRKGVALGCTPQHGKRLLLSNNILSTSCGRRGKRSEFVGSVTSSFFKHGSIGLCSGHFLLVKRRVRLAGKLLFSTSLA